MSTGPRLSAFTPEEGVKKDITLGLFTIVQLQRKVQMMIPAYDFCIPDKESEYSTGDPCEMFKKIQFPMEDFFPPRLSEFRDDCGSQNS